MSTPPMPIRAWSALPFLPYYGMIQTSGLQMLTVQSCLAFCKLLLVSVKELQTELHLSIFADVYRLKPVIVSVFLQERKQFEHFLG